LALTETQRRLVETPLNQRIFLEGPANCGKTTVGVERLLHLMQLGVPADSILLLLPQRTLAGPYLEAIHHPGVVTGGMVTLLTLGGLSRRMVDLFWPYAAQNAGFTDPEQLPVFLTLETAQYYMAHIAGGLLAEGLFSNVPLERNRLYSQILDNLNKAAVVGFPHTEIGTRLKAAWQGDPGQLRIYEDVQTCASQFRAYCLVNNLLDFSLQVELLRDQLWPRPDFREYLFGRFQHLIADNIEEDVPLTHDILAEWLPQAESACLIYDQQAGFRSFLGADAESAYRLKSLCDQPAELLEPWAVEPGIDTMRQALHHSIQRPLASLGGQAPPPNILEWADAEQKAHTRLAVRFTYERYYPQMLDWVAKQVAAEIYDNQVPPGEIVVLAPFLSDALRHGLTVRLEAQGIPARSHRPSRSLREEPAVQCLLSLAMLAYPEWGYVPSPFDIAYALLQSIAEIDLVRAQLLARIVYRVKDGQAQLSPFDIIRPEVQERITYRLGARYQLLRDWLENSQGSGAAELDIFFSRLFGEVLSQPGFGFHTDYNAAQVTANLIESIQKFRWVTGDILQAQEIPLGKEYLRMVQEGVIAAQYLYNWQAEPTDAVFLAPAHTFLMSNRPVEVQFWLDSGSRGWSERLYQPLTHPYVLSRNWPPDRIWSEMDELKVNIDTMDRLTNGLLRRCRGRVYLGLSELGEQGYEQRGPLLHAIQRVLRQLAEGESA
jgi:hypothetical protein